MTYCPLSVVLPVGRVEAFSFIGFRTGTGSIRGFGPEGLPGPGLGPG
jgi:hypothetical protein